MKWGKISNIWTYIIMVVIFIVIVILGVNATPISNYFIKLINITH